MEGVSYEHPRSEKELEILAQISRLKAREIELEGNYSKKNDTIILNVRTQINKLEGDLRRLQNGADNSLAA